MKVPLYILGFLIKHGPQHGYKLKQIITEEVSTFTKIKQPTIYYHLERMLKDGLVTSKAEQEGNRPERSVYKITRKGRAAFAKHLDKALASNYEPEFLLDAVLYFISAVEKEKALEVLRKKEKVLDAEVSELLLKSTEVLLLADEKESAIMKSIFNHRIYHYQIELKWVRETIKDIERMPIEE